MARLIFGIGAIVALIIALFVGPPLQERIERDNIHRRQIQLLEQQQQAFDLAQYQQKAIATLPGEIAGDYALRLLLFGACIVVIWMVVDAYRQRRAPLVRADQHGLFPVSRQHVIDGALTDLVREVAIETVRAMQLRAIHQPGQAPASLNYHPTYSHRLSDQAAGETHPSLSLPAQAPTFAELLHRGRVGQGNPLVLGFDVETGKELTGSWLDLYSTIVAGLPGSGKTTSQRFWACQVALYGAKFAICDPHAGAAADSLAATLDPLRAAFLCEPSSSDKAILDVVRLVDDIGDRRIKGKDNDITPVILWLDETTALLGRSSIASQLKELIERIAQEYRKRHVFCCASGQIWSAERTSSELRDSFASVLCHRMKRNQARMLLPTDEAERVERLETGRAVLWRSSGATTTVQIPLTTANDVQAVAHQLATPRLPDRPPISQTGAADMPSDMPKRSQKYAAGDVAYPARLIPAVSLLSCPSGQRRTD